MLEITVPPEVLAKFEELLKEEDSDDAVVRIRETKVGGGCKSRIVLKVSIDEREDPDEEQETKVGGLPFVVNNEVIDSHGEKFEIFVNEAGVPDVRAAA